jgi:hypothetical protein
MLSNGAFSSAINERTPEDFSSICLPIYGAQRAGEGRKEWGHDDTSGASGIRISGQSTALVN